MCLVVNKRLTSCGRFLCLYFLIGFSSGENLILFFMCTRKYSRVVPVHVIGVTDGILELQSPLGAMEYKQDDIVAYLKKWNSCQIPGRHQID